MDLCESYDLNVIIRKKIQNLNTFLDLKLYKDHGAVISQCESQEEITIIRHH